MTTEINDIITYDFGNRWAAVMDYDIRKYHEGRIIPMQDRIAALEAVRGMDGREVELKKDYYPPLAEGATPEEGQEPAVIWRLKPRSDADPQEWKLLVFISEIKGDKGDEGIQGERGPRGLPGVDGQGIHLYGTVATSNDLRTLTDAEIGRCWLALDTKHVWLCKGLPASVTSSWEDLGTITGIKGEKGDTGATGATGARGPRGDKGDSGGISSFLLNWVVGTATNQAISAVTMQLNTSINDAINDMAMQLGNLAEDAAESAISKTFEDMYDELKGEKGQDGKDGKDGTVCTIVGTVSTVADLPLLGSPGEGYLVGPDNDLYLWVSPVWKMVGNIKGDKGDKGEKGDPGDAALPALVADKFLSNNGVEVEWVDIGLPNSANKDEANDFTNLDQTIGGYTIMNAIYSPRLPSVAATRAGMMHIKIPNSDSDTTAKVWVSVATTGGAYEWVELETGTGSGDVPADVVTKNKPNDFNNVEQTIGSNQIVTVIDGGANSVPTGIMPDFDGQLFLSYRNTGTPEAQGAMWVAKGNQWLPIASEGGGSVDESNLAKLDAQNIFAMPQLIGEVGQRAKFVSGRRTSHDPTSSSSPDFLPYAEGDLLFRHYLDGGVSKEQIYMAGVAGDAHSWVLLYDSEESVTAVAGDLALLDTRVDALSDKLDLEITDLDNLSKTVGDIDLSITGIEGDVSLIGSKVDLLEPRIIANENKIAALETHHTNNQTTFDDHEDRITATETTGDDHETRITSLEAGGGSGSVDLSPVTDRLDEVDTKLADILSGDYPVSELSFGCNTVLTKGSMNATATSSSRTILSTATSAQTITMGEIVQSDSTTLGATQIREGGVIRISNKGTQTLTILPHTGHTFFRGSSSMASIEVGNQQGVSLFPAIYGDGSKRYIVIDSYLVNQYPAPLTQVETLETAVDAVETTVTSHGTSIDTLETGLEATDTKVATIETTVTGNSASLSALDTRVTTAETTIVSHAQKHLRTERDVERLQTTTGNHTTSITTLETTTGTHTTTIAALEAEIDDLTTKLAAAEALLATHTTDITNVEDECSNLQIGIDGNQAEIVLAKGRLDTVEAKLPETLEAGKLLVVNSAGDGVEMSTLSSAEALGLKAFAEGSATGDTLLSTKCLGGDTLIYSGNATAAQTSWSNFVFGVPGSGTTKTCELGDIVSYNSTDVGEGKVREGCLLTIVNAGAGTLRVSPAGATKVQGRNGSWDQYDIPSNKTLLLIPQIWSDGTKCYNIVGIFPNLA